MKQCEVITAIFKELKKAESKFPGWPSDIVHAAAIVAEESGELVQASIDCYYGRGSEEKCIKEAIQTAAMSVRFLLNMADKPN